MAYDIGPKIGIDGEAEFRKAIQNINTNIRTLGTEMLAVTSAYDSNDKSAAALTSRNGVLTKQIDAQRSKLAELQQGLNASAEKYGESDEKTQRWQQTVNVATAELNKMERQLKENNQALSDQGGHLDGLKSKLSAIGSGLATAAKAGAAAVAAASAAVGVLVKQSVEGYGEFEQLVGGVKTLFKDSAGIVTDYANNAYKTAGLSANAYMETVTGFSASLLQSLNNDTEAAARVADQAITDMADNANKMGTSMESIQNAYQGFAKQNYTMLDNLKLGYGGTKEEMQRLLEDAEKLSGQEFDLSSYADIVEAIHVVQTEMGITGTTAKEAATTIQGSVGAAKAAWQNLVVGIADENADLGGLIDNFVESAATAAENIIPRMEQSMVGIAETVQALAPAISEQLPDLIANVSPPLISAGTELTAALVVGLVSAAPKMLEGSAALVDALGDGLANQIPELSFVFENLETVVAGTTAAFVAFKGAAAVSQLMDTLKTATEGQTVAQLALNTVMNANPYVLVATLIAGVVTALVTLYNTNEDFRNKVNEVWASVKTSVAEGAAAVGNFFTVTIPNAGKQALEWLTSIPDEMKNIGINIVSGIWSGISEKASWLKEKVAGFLDGVVDSVKGVLGIHSPSTLFRDEIGQYISLGIAEGISDSSDKAVKAADDLAKDVYSRSKDWADRQTKYMDLSLSEQIALWETIQSQFIAESKQYAEAEEKIFDLKAKQQTEYYSELKTAAERMTKYQKLSLREQLDTWRNIQDQFAKDSKQYLQAEEKVMDLRAQLQDEYLDKVEDTNKQISDLAKNYYETLEKRQEQIANSYGLFDEATERQEVSGEDLLQNLRDQVSAMKAFYSGLDELTERGVGEALVDEIRQLGPSAGNELEALLGLSDQKLSQYANVYQEKQQLANRVALDELKDLKLETNAQIAENLKSLQDYCKLNAPEVGLSFAAGIAEGIRSGTSGVTDAVSQIAATMRQAVSGISGNAGYGAALSAVQSRTERSFSEMAAISSGKAGHDAVSRGTPWVFGGGTNSGDIASAVRQGLSGAAVYMDGKKVGRMVTEQQDNDNKAWDR